MNDEVLNERDDFLNQIEDFLIYWEYSGCHEFALFDCLFIIRDFPVHQQAIIEVRLQNFDDFVDLIVKESEYGHSLNQDVFVFRLFHIQNIKESDVLFVVLG